MVSHKRDYCRAGPGNKYVMQCYLDLELPAICMVELCKGVTSYMMSNCVRTV